MHEGIEGYVKHNSDSSNKYDEDVLHVTDCSVQNKKRYRVRERIPYKKNNDPLENNDEK